MGQTWNGDLVHDAGNVVSDIGGWFSGPPGDPGRIRQVAGEIESLRDRFDTEHRALNEAIDELTRSWTGDGASAFRATWYGGGGGPAPDTVLTDASKKLDEFARNLRDYADQLQHAQDEHWIQMGILAALTVVNAAQLGADPATDAAEVGAAAGTAVGTSFALADVASLAIDGAIAGFSSDVISQLGADLLDRLNPQFDQTGDHAVNPFNAQEALFSGVAGGVTGGALGAGGQVLRTLLTGPVEEVAVNGLPKDVADDLAAYRERSGMPVAWTEADDATAARLDIPGSDPLYGRNAEGVPITMKVNAQTATHAEASVFQQALNAGVTAERVTMYVDRPLCDACGRYGGIGSMLRATGIGSVEVVAPDGRFLITAVRPSVPLPLPGTP